MSNKSLAEIIDSKFDVNHFNKLNWTGNFNDYIHLIAENPKIISSAWQRLYNMIISKGSKEVVRFKKKYVKYNFFSQSDFPIFGLEHALMQFVDTIKSGAMGYGPEHRIMLFHGPVGSSKSTICTCIKRGMEEYSKTDDGAIYSFSWIIDENLRVDENEEIIACPINEDPLNILPKDIRKELINNIVPESFWENNSDSHLNNPLCPKCEYYFNAYMEKYNGNINHVLEHIKVRRFVLSEKLRRGIGTFQPKDEKNQDATELTGDINFRKLGKIGVDSDPRAFNFDGEFQIANRGVLEFIEVLKLSKEFLYDLLGATQEHQIKPKKFSQMTIDEVLIAHTNGPEFSKLQSDDTMEALRDRTIRVDIPYLIRWEDEIKIYKNVYNEKTVKQHIMPHTLEMAALWAIITRLSQAKDRSITIVEKAKLYNGQSLPGWTEDKIKELHELSSTHESMKGISARFVQNMISNTLVVPGRKCINTFMILNEIKKGMEKCSLVTDEDTRKTYSDMVSDVQKELDEILKDEIQKALIGDKDAIKKLCVQYIDNIVAFVEKSKIINPITEREEPPNERLMRSIEEKIDISEQYATEFRRSIVGHIGALASKGEKFNFDSNPKLLKALQFKLFEDTKDTIKLAKLSESVSAVDKDLQEKIDSIKKRLKDDFGYCDQCAADVLSYVSSIFSRGDLMKGNN